MITNLFIAEHLTPHTLLQVDPLDAGTDNGFTFTSPNWPTIPKVMGAIVVKYGNLPQIDSELLRGPNPAT